MDTAYSAVTAGADCCCVVRSLGERTKVFFPLEELFVIAVAVVIVLINGLKKVVNIDTALLSQLFERICLEQTFVAGLLSDLYAFCKVGDIRVEADHAYLINTVSHVILNDGGINDAVKHTAFCMRAGIAEVCGVLHLLFVHDTLAVLVDKKVRLHQNVRNALRKLIDSFEVSGLLDADRNFVSACFPCHADTVAGVARDSKVEHINAEGVTGLLFDELRICSCAAGADDSCLAGDGDLFAALVDSDYAADLAFVVLKDLLACCLKHKGNAELLSSCVECFVHEGSGTRSDTLIGLDDVPCGLRFGEVFVCAFELNAHVLEPLDGLCGLLKISLDQTSVYIVMGVFHEHFQRFFYSDVDHLSLLIFGTDSQRSHTHVSCAADSRVFLDQNNFCSVFRRLNSCRKSGRAACDNNDLCFIICHMIYPLSPVLCTGL